MSDRAPLRILFLAANPQSTTRLQIDEEVRQIDRELRLTEYRDRFELLSHGALRFDDLQELLLRYQPHVVHFSGHGSQVGEIILNGVDGAQPIPPAALASLFAILKDNVRCVVLNACYSKAQAKAISKHIDCVVGMSEQISDTASIGFSVSFYRALGYGRTLQEAFDLGCNALEPAQSNEKQKPQLLRRTGTTAQFALIDPPTASSEATATQPGAPDSSSPSNQASTQNSDSKALPVALRIFVHSWWKRITLGATIGVLLTLIGLWADVLSIRSALWPSPTATSFPVTPTGALPTATLTIATATSQPAAFTYGVTVYSKDNQPIEGAIVRIEIESKAPLDEYSDSNGYARIFIPAALVSHPGRLTIQADGYAVKTLDIDLWSDQLPDKVQLARQ